MASKAATRGPTNAEIVRLLEQIRNELADLNRHQAQLSKAVKELAKR